MRSTKKRVLTGLATCLLMICLAGVAFAVTIDYSLSKDWSDIQNPNGVWSLNSGNTVMTEPFDERESTGWELARDDSTNPSWAKRYKDTSSSWNDEKIGDIIAQAGWHTSARTNVTWTSLYDGTIDISGSSWDAIGGLYGPRDGGWSLEVNGVIVSSRESILNLKRTGEGADFTDNLAPGVLSLNGIAVHAGEVVMFSVGGLSTSGVDLNIALTTDATVPEPATMLLLGSGLVGMAAFRRKLKK